MNKRLTIIGGGIPGLALGLDCLQRCGVAGAKVQIFDAGAKPSSHDIGDQRTTAFLPPSVDYLENLSVWASVSDHAAALTRLRIVDDRGDNVSAPLIETFDASEFSERPFAENVSNAALRASLIEQFEALGGTIHWHQSFTLDEPHDLAQLEQLEGESDLLVGADGQNSVVRQHLGIELDRRTPDQRALVCTATHTLDQGGTSTEFHRDAGPFTLVPAPPADNGSPRTAIVWVEAPQAANVLAALSPPEFANALQTNARGLLGQVIETTRPVAIPVATQQTVGLGRAGALLMAEAAHALPPIGAQGLNLSLMDARALGTLLQDSDDWASPALFDAYQRARCADIGMRLNATDLLNRVTTWRSELRWPVTYAALGMLKHINPLRQAVVKRGLGL